MLHTKLHLNNNLRSNMYLSPLVLLVTDKLTQIEIFRYILTTKMSGTNLHTLQPSTSLHIWVEIKIYWNR